VNAVIAMQHCTISTATTEQSLKHLMTHLGMHMSVDLHTNYSTASHNSPQLRYVRVGILSVQTSRVLSEPPPRSIISAFSFPHADPTTDTLGMFYSATIDALDSRRHCREVTSLLQSETSEQVTHTESVSSRNETYVPSAMFVFFLVDPVRATC
jgi:hypothetical protein